LDRWDRIVTMGNGQWQGATATKMAEARSRRFPDLREDEAERASR
jgi:hypothetical protein